MAHPGEAGGPEALRSGLTPAQREQVRARLRSASQAAPRASAIPRAAPSSTQPLSFAQRRMWYLERTLQGSPRYTIPLAFDVSGLLDVSALRLAAHAVAVHHAALGSVFREVDGDVIGVEPEGPCVRFQALSGSAGQDIDALVRRHAAEPFNLERGPLFRVLVLTLAPDRHVLLLCLHHIVADAWSANLLLADLGDAYRSVRHGEPARLPPSAIEYADYATWEATWLGSDQAERQLAFWRTELADAQLVLDVSPVRTRPAVQRGLGRDVWRTLPDPAVRGAHELARAEGATLFMVLLSALAALLSRYSGHADLVLGIPVAGRTRTELERVVGLFVNTLPVRIVLHGRPSFRELVRRVRDATLRAYANQDVPFDRVIQEVRPPRSPGRTPVVQILADHQQASVPRLDGLRLTHRPVDTGTAKFDLSFTFVTRADKSLELLLNHDLDLFDDAAAGRMAVQYAQVLRSGVDAPDRLVDALDLLPTAERRLLGSSHGGDRDLPSGPVLDNLLDRPGGPHPAGIAISFADTRIDYPTMHRWSSRLANQLRAAGFGADDVVGMSAERSVEMVVALLATLKVGVAFLPLDPEGPPARLAHAVAQARPALILAPPGGTERFAMLGPALCPVGPPSALPALGRGPVPPDTPLDALAYVMYTSGSSGTPKGVMVSRRAIFNRLAWMATEYPLRSDDAVLHKTPLTFDVSLWELLWPLAVGARLIVAEPGAHRNPEALAELIARERVTVAHFVPSLLHPFLDVVARGDDRVRTLRQVFCSGEALTPDLVARVHSALPGVALHNLYGPTEAAIEVSAWPCTGDDRSVIPIGRPAPNCRLYVLDGELHQRPVGQPGDLYIGGIQLARGYLGQPDLTAQTFLPDPFAGPGARMYRTGDRAAVRADGAIEFLGRVDRQVKIRGYRVELAEIEAALTGCPGVARAAVVVRGHGGDERIVAYLVPDSRPVPAGELRARLRETLPAYMIPAAYVWCDQLSLTASGKLDYRALPDAGDEARVKAPADPEPAGELERRIGAVLAAELDLTAVGRHDDFFDLGGHSLLAVRVTARLSRELGVDLPLRTFLADPTVAGLALAAAGSTPALSVAESSPACAPKVPVAPAAPIAASGAARHGVAPILVTGATGMIGSFVVVRLRRLGQPVRLLSRPSGRDPAGESSGVDVVTADMADVDGIRRAARGASAIIHLASTFGRTSVDIAATAALAEAWAGDIPGGFVFVSTVDVYGRPRQVPVTEEHPVDAGYGPYALSKIRGEELLLQQAARCGRDDVTILRPPYVWGPHPYCRWQLRVGAGHAFYRAVRDHEPILLPGSGETGTAAYGHAWVDARELADVVCASLDRAAGGALNVVNDHFSWIELYDLLSELTGQQPEIQYCAPEQDFHHVVRRYSTTRLVQRLGFTPAYDWRVTLRQVLGGAAGRP